MVAGASAGLDGDAGLSGGAVHAADRPGRRATAEEVAGLLGGSDAVIVDARDADQYTGRIRRGSRGGHIPGALNVPREALFDANGTFKNATGLSEALDASAVPRDRQVVAYCNGGVAATPLRPLRALDDRRPAADELRRLVERVGGAERLPVEI